ncbi:MAG: CehA/McbA family metallohydrolase [Clostridia bacterium]|nr:CehA/McbA family metallohydrolase [Clostridia bacterium]
MIVKADLHIHSNGSADGCSTLSALISAAQAKGLNAIAICDHDRQTVLPEQSPILLIPGIEITAKEGHVLGLFLEKNIALDALGKTPSVAAAVSAIHTAGGIVVLAHPFAPQKLPEADLQKLHMDAIEIVNARAALKHGANARAAALAETMGLAVTGASDAHCAKEVGGGWTEFEVSDCSLSALRTALLEKKTTAVLGHPCRWCYKARSRMKKRCLEHGFIGFLRTLPYALGCIARDILHI